MKSFNGKAHKNGQSGDNMTKSTSSIIVPWLSVGQLLCVPFDSYCLLPTIGAVQRKIRFQQSAFHIATENHVMLSPATNYLKDKARQAQGFAWVLAQSVDK